MKKDFLQSLVCLAVLVFALLGLKMYDKRTGDITGLAHTVYGGLVR